jgi:hypothetical protein
MPQKRDWKDWLGFDSARGSAAPGDPRNGAGEKRQGENSGNGTRRLRPTAAIAVAIAVGFLVWLLLIKGGGDDSTPDGNQTSSQPKAVSVVSELELLSALKGAGYPIYWAGPRAEVEYEVSRPSQDRTFIRYLPKGEEAESERAFLTVGSYQQPGALAQIRELGQEPGAVLVQAAGGGSAYAEGPDATSAYLAFPGVNTQIEVYVPEGGQALSLIRSGAILPVG